MNSVDPRVFRTRRLLIDALIELIVDEGYDAVTVREIVRKAEVNRSTFYLHFRDKQDIFAYMGDELLKQLAESVRNPTFTFESALRDYNNSKRPITSAVTLFKHVQKYAALYRTMLVERDFREHVTQCISTEILRYSTSPSEAAFGSNGIVGLIIYWLQTGMKESVEEMSLWLTRVSLFPMGHFE
ncbi:TetR/AcrR family transcriptional regulator [Alicyclobacillus dauci]|uniref:TetR/AcrR family transcriptional regulator n=1 Tax=Alicyclobacillus dauci TaxID=1475485 RepID=A0ABY6Z590_9BACL|nr:TetR/AcrR family transcriptional regulator [Alicyclobacillus dauci]WAH38026.1 TetR/AcrR family transcriptional regulator [Alicyclobacillus dauci]